MAAPQDTRAEPQLDHRYEALVLDLEAVVTAARGMPADAAAAIEACRREGLDVVMLDDARHDGDRDRAVRAALAELWERGIAPSQVLVWDGGAPALHEVLADQLARRHAGELPSVADEAGWTMLSGGRDPRLERATEALLALGDGRVGTRASAAVPLPESDPGTRIAGVYRGEGPETDLLPGPIWNLLATAGTPRDVQRRLDLHAGVLAQRVTFEDGTAIDVVELASLAAPGIAALRASAPAELLADRQGLTAPDGRGPFAERLAVTTAPGSIAAAAADTRRLDPGDPGDAVERLERVAAYTWNAAGSADLQHAIARAAEMKLRGFDALLADHRAAWARRWARCDVAIDGDPELQLAVRLGLHHLIASTPAQGEAAVGARGLSGGAYRGHVFWDADAFVLPFHAATCPAAARAMLEYRVARLPAALEEARERGRAGARFPWESAATGREVTPPAGMLQTGEQVPIRTGLLEDHIVADVARAAHVYTAWTGDEAFAAGPGRVLLVETARFWASRIVVDGGRAHIRGVIGPDEYHEDVDDNTYTNVMARWNLRAAADAAQGDPDLASERAHWLLLAELLVDGFDPATRRHEQHAGFSDLEPLVIEELVPHRPVAAPVLLGTQRVAQAQVLKQADVLMLHDVAPEEAPPGSLLADLDFYEPRTAHGSTLSPGVHAALLARAGRPEEALRWLRVTAAIDMDDLGGTTPGGVHLAAMASLWRALAWGFAGISPAEDALVLDPRPLPATWDALEVRVAYRGTPLRVRIDRETAEVAPQAPIAVRGPGDDEPRTIGPGGARFRLRPEREPA